MSTCAILACGPSIIGQDLTPLNKVDVIAINNSWQLIPDAMALYACDRAWWEHHKFVPEFNGKKYTQEKGWGNKWPEGIEVLKSENKLGLCKEKGKINNGYNSGHQAINLAYHLGYARLVLVGFDCQMTGGKRHWFGDHPGRLNRKSPYNLFIKAFNQLALDLKNEKIEVINCSAQSALTCFERGNLEEVL